jgi:hypothetical protein
MTAYELADELENYVWMNPNNNRDYCKEVKDMLRQQADRIAELEKELYFKNYYEELPDTPVGIIGKIGDSPIHDLVHRTTPQIKELSDEEIDEVLYSMDWAHDPVKFARVILRKAQEK